MHATEPLVENSIIPTVFASGLARIEDVGGGMLLFTFYEFRKSTVFADERRERVVVARIAMAASVVPEAALAAEIAANGILGAVGEIVVARAKH